MVLAEVSSYRAASEMLNITQPALTRRIQKLETLLESKLLARTTRDVQLTAAGIMFLEKIRPIVVDAESIVVQMRQTGSRQQGLIRLGCLPSVGVNLLPSVIREYQELFPRVAFRILDGNALSVVQMVLNNQVDIGIGMQMGTQSDLQHQYLLSDSIGIICHPEHPVADISKDILTWQQLQDFPLVYNLNESGNRLLINSRLEELGINLKWVHQAQSLFGAIIFGESAIALAPAPSTISEALTKQGLKFFRVKDPEIQRKIHLIEKPGATRSSYLQHFLQVLESRIAEDQKTRSG